MKIYLIGMPKAGKTTLGKKLAQHLHWRFIDLDDLIEERTTQTIAEMFQKGEAYFRLKETEALASLKLEDNLVVACGGGTVLKSENKCLMNGLIIFLDCDVETLKRRDDLKMRPLLLKNRLEDLYRQRIALYEAFADYRVSNINMDDALKQIEEIYENTSNKWS